MTDRGNNHPHSGQKGIYLGPVAFEMRLGVLRVETHQQGSGVNRKYPHRQFLPLLATRGGAAYGRSTYAMCYSLRATCET